MSKLEEGEKYLKIARKHLTKTMFHWNLDYLSAAPALEKAANAFRAGGDLNQSKKLFAEAALAQVQNQTLFKAAQLMESAAKVAIEQFKKENNQKYINEAKNYFQKAAGFYSDMGEFKKASDSLQKGAVLIEESNVDLAAAMYLESCSLVESMDKPHFSIESFRKATAFMVKNKMYQQAIDILKRLISQYQACDQTNPVHKCYLSITVVQLAMGDIVAADESYMHHLQDDAFLHADECALSEDLLMAFKNGNEDSIKEIVRKPGFNYLENDIARLAKRLSIYGKKKKASPTPKNRAPKSSTKPARDATNSKVDVNSRDQLFGKSPKDVQKAEETSATPKDTSRSDVSKKVESNDNGLEFDFDMDDLVDEGENKATKKNASTAEDDFVDLT